MRVLFANSAFSDLAEIQAYYLDQGVPHVGQKLIADIISHIETLADHPQIGRVVPEFSDPTYAN